MDVAGFLLKGPPECSDTTAERRSREAPNPAFFEGRYTKDRGLRGVREMKEPAQEIVVLVTASSEEEAARIGRALVEGGLAACANVLPRIRSIFRWEGKVSEEQESLMVVKSRSDLFDDLARTVKSLHSYQVPEIIAVPIAHGSPEYLAWIHEVTRQPK